MSRSIFIAAALALAVTLPAVSAQAQSPRTFVSAAGSDSNPCSFAAPCRHFQAAVNATSAGGEVDALDPAGYGPITISQAITIEGQGWSYIAPPTNGAAIIINTVSGNVAIRGVSLNGVGITGTTTGIQFNSGGSLTVGDSVIRNFSGDGIDFEPSTAAKLVVSNSVVSDNGDAGIAVFPSGSGGHTVNINRVETNNNVSYGVFLWGSLGNGDINAAVSESTFSASGVGLYALTDASHSTVKLNVFHSVVTMSKFGIAADGAGATIITANSMSTENLGAWNTLNGGVVQSYGDNYFIGNLLDGTGPSLINRQ
jgi:hypothetical protein